ncbi:hypothetical protein KY348_01310 [Candidatus Woesearchaeota archaeon]|nr:hypothetical protein [Candidatus Woesearchaeota archaeon]
MKSKKLYCVFCDTELKPTMLSIDGLKLEGLKCPKCGDKVFDEKQFHTMVVALDQRRLKEEYKKQPVRIGHSTGVIFPKDIVKVFNLDAKGTELGIRAYKAKNKIEITVL